VGLQMLSSSFHRCKQDICVAYLFVGIICIMHCMFFCRLEVRIVSSNGFI
jgi:hypothetical protein